MPSHDTQFNLHLLTYLDYIGPVQYGADHANSWIALFWTNFFSCVLRKVYQRLTCCDNEFEQPFCAIDFGSQLQFFTKTWQETDEF